MLVKPALCLVLGIISSYFCAVYIFESNHFEQYMNYVLKDYENPSGAMIGLVPEFVVLVNLVVSIIAHLIAIVLDKLFKGTFITSLIKQILWAFCVLLFIGFCSMVTINLLNVYEGYLIPALIPNLFWVAYGCMLLFTYFKSQKVSFDYKV